jgi:hypothetical protein
MLARVVALLMSMTAGLIIADWLGLINRVSALTLSGTISVVAILFALTISALYIYTRLD